MKAVKLIACTIAAAVMLGGILTFADTNLPPSAPPAPSAPPQPSPAALKVADDVRQLVVDTFTLASGASWSGILLSAYLAIKGVRNRTSLGKNPVFAPLLNLLNIEAKGDYSQPVVQKPVAALPPP